MAEELVERIMVVSVSDPLHAAMLLKEEATRLAAWERQLVTQGESVTAHALAACAEQAAALAVREAAVGPQEQAVSQREAAVGIREAHVASQTETLSVQARVVTHRQEEVARQEHEGSEWRRSERQLLSRERATLTADRAQLEQERLVFHALQGRKDREAMEAKRHLDDQRSTHHALETALHERTVKLDALLAEASESTEAARARERDVEARCVARETALDTRESALKNREASLDDHTRRLGHQEVAVAAREQAAESLAKGLNKSKLDVETKAHELERRERLVEALVKHHGLEKELSAL